MLWQQHAGTHIGEISARVKVGTALEEQSGYQTPIPLKQKLKRWVIPACQVLFIFPAFWC